LFEGFEADKKEANGTEKAPYAFFWPPLPCSLRTPSLVHKICANAITMNSVLIRLGKVLTERVIWTHCGTKVADVTLASTSTLKKRLSQNWESPTPRLVVLK
jgi:hypothetical protein